MRATLLLAATALALSAGCGAPPPRPPASHTSVTAPSLTELRAEADALARRGEHAAAAERYRAALTLTPDDLVLHFSLGSMLSHLDLEDEAAEQFRWVLEHGRPGQPEVVTARQWLATARPDSRVARAARERRLAPAPAQLGTVQGTTSWPGVDPDKRRVPVELRIDGESPETAQMRMRVRVRLGRPYTFVKLPAGRYRLVASSEGTKLWEVRTLVEGGKDTTLDLSEANSLVEASAFPPKQG